MNHIGLAIILRPDCYDEYKRRHDELWPKMHEAMSRYGISMIIYRFGQTLFIHGQAPREQSWQDMAKDPVTPRWNQYMAEVLETDDKGEIVFHTLPKAFDFGQYK